MYIAIEGVIGVGKTTLARLMQPYFDARLLLEIFEENPFLSDFYSDRARYAFQTQIFFLLSRYHQQHKGVREALASNPWLLSDYTFEKDRLFAEVNLQGDELNMYYNVHDALAEKIIKPDLVVYLQADTDVLMQRIAQRDRPYERQMEIDYIHTLNLTYEKRFANHPSQNCLTINTNYLDYVRNPDDLEAVNQRIRQALKMAPFQESLPIDL
ncbi:MAG TPA: deoxynucleoside kinase [Brevefilum fermentans]|jgi:deoxyguanosine kinase|uniref:Putative deoxynucleoside kinase n=1 Tax=Candidatus Brevifilum fermentans TaxID=1986204 RepID=A0A1Y6K5A4_9CHLR|nr:deoxynucleoside kinase [Brevefilum fermentans]MDI9565575.1 deoxynucleoside kinase [Chloroflexota bacterium]OQB87552.1 MAG: Deoxyguanosine kinase [Chloroflexi bacterium ADurb.Bin120]SMX53210.1 putative deoxynucleoside kinase [Brevefilum fermentans]HOM67802.1 deoxynucleoside kinase [Brevefilum fermentans]HPX95174.1 deoxynucleoside kinase [Brevefilum fermentans]